MIQFPFDDMATQCSKIHDNLLTHICIVYAVFLCLFYHNLTSIEYSYPKPNVRLQCRFMRITEYHLVFTLCVCDCIAYRNKRMDIYEFYVITMSCVYCACECECMKFFLKNQVNYLSLLDFSVNALLFVFSFTSTYETNRTSIIITRRT